jgi:hypothetical protein
MNDLSCLLLSSVVVDVVVVVVIVAKADRKLANACDCRVVAVIRLFVLISGAA